MFKVYSPKWGYLSYDQYPQMWTNNFPFGKPIEYPTIRAALKGLHRKGKIRKALNIQIEEC